MARFDRCEMCDYSAENGSVYANCGPRSRGKVRLHYGQLLCDVCNGSVNSAMEDYAREDAAKELEQASEPVEDTASTVSVR